MTGAEMKAIRQRLGLSTVQLGRAFGYAGNDNTTSVMIRKYESDGRPIPAYLERLLILFDRHGVPDGWTEATTQTKEN
jgi:transcriptional regulator with XRE-family HTH domain